jgi:hypothetical protein
MVIFSYYNCVLSFCLNDPSPVFLLSPLRLCEIILQRRYKAVVDISHLATVRIEFFRSLWKRLTRCDGDDGYIQTENGQMTTLSLTNITTDFGTADPSFDNSLL